jgi:uncharacterized protein YdaU (DUF1376 family)
VAEFPALPLFTDSLIADTEHLTDEAFGAYMRLLIKMWRSPECRIPCADAQIIHMHRGDANKVNNLIKPLLVEFCQSDGAFYRQKRLSKEFAYVRSVRQKKRGAAKARWNKEKDPCISNAPTPHPTPPSVKKIDIPSGSFEEFWNIYPRHIAKQTALAAYRKARKGGTTHEAIITGTRRYADECRGKEQRYIAHASTWLNGGRWDDAPGANLDTVNGAKQNGRSNSNRYQPQSRAELIAELVSELPQDECGSPGIRLHENEGYTVDTDIKH